MKENIHVFDFQRIFFGNYSWTFALEIVFRTTLLYLYAMLLLRLLGKRGMGQLSAFEYVIIFALGAAVGDPMLYADVPVLHGMVVITVIVFLQRGLVRLSERNAKFEAFVESRTRRVVLNGSLDLAAMHGESLAREELFSALREAGMEQLGQVNRAYLEPSGRVSVFRLPAHEVGPGLSLMPPTDEELELRRSDNRAMHQQGPNIV